MTMTEQSSPSSAIGRDKPLYCGGPALAEPARDELSFLRAQRAAISAWQQQRDALPAKGPQMGREQGLVLDRQRESFDREQAALARWLGSQRLPLAAQLRATPSIVIAHRHSWTVQALVAGLSRVGWHVLDADSDAATALAGAVARQPDVLMISDRLRGADALDSLRRLRTLAPATRLVVQLDEDGRLLLAREVGAHTVLSHRTRTSRLLEMLDDLRHDSGADRTGTRPDGAGFLTAEEAPPDLIA